MNETEKRKQLVSEALAEPEIKRGRRLTGVLLLLCIFVRVLLLVMEVIFSNAGKVTLPVGSVVSLSLQIALALLVYNGFRWPAALWLLGGLLTIVNANRNGVASILFLDASLQLKLYAGLLLAAGWLQLLVSAALLFLPPCKAYFTRMEQIGRQVTGAGSGPRL